MQASGIMQPIQTSPVNLYNNNNNSNNKLFPPQQPPQQPQQKSMDPFGSLLWKMWNFTKLSRIFSRTLHHHCTTFSFVFPCIASATISVISCFLSFYTHNFGKGGFISLIIYFLVCYLFFCCVSKVKMSHFSIWCLKKILTLGTYLVHFSLGPSHFWTLGGSNSEGGGLFDVTKIFKYVHCAANT